MEPAVRCCCVAVLGAGLGACTGSGGPQPPPATTLNVSDGNVFQPVLRGTLNFEDASSTAPSDPHTGHALEFGFTRGRGTSSQDLPSNYVSFGGKQFNGPATLSSDFTLTYLDMTYRYRMVDRHSGLGFEVLGGIAVAEFDLSVASPSQRANESLSSPGMQLGTGVLWRARPGTSVHARGSWFRSLDDTEVTHAARYDIYLAQSLGRHAALRAGYTWWSLDSDRRDTISPIKVEFRGPTLGLELMF